MPYLAGAYSEIRLGVGQNRDIEKKCLNMEGTVCLILPWHGFARGPDLFDRFGHPALAPICSTDLDTLFSPTYLGTDFFDRLGNSVFSTLPWHLFVPPT